MKRGTLSHGPVSQSGWMTGRAPPSQESPSFNLRGNVYSFRLMLPFLSSTVQLLDLTTNRGQQALSLSLLSPVRCSTAEFVDYRPASPASPTSLTGGASNANANPTLGRRRRPEDAKASLALWLRTLPRRNTALATASTTQPLHLRSFQLQGQASPPQSARQKTKSSRSPLVASQVMRALFETFKQQNPCFWLPPT